MAGRPRKPTKQKQIAGTIRPDRENPNEPEFADAGTKPPAGLSAAGKRIWNEVVPELTETGVLKSIQRHLLVEYCECLATAQKCRQVFAKQGRNYRTRTATGSVMIRERPEVKIYDKMLSQARQIATQFGLTPASQAKVSGKPKDHGEEKGKARFFRQA